MASASCSAETILVSRPSCGAIGCNSNPAAGVGPALRTTTSVRNRAITLCGVGHIHAAGGHTLGVVDDEKKLCTGCGEVKPLEEFARRNNRPNGRQPRCKACQAAWKAANRERIRALASVRSARPEVRERNRAAMRRFRAARPERSKEINEAASKRTREQVFDHYGRVCACCGATEDLNIDHLGGGGAKHRKALFGSPNAAGDQFYRWLVREGFPPGFAVLCGPCNQSKGDGWWCRLDHAVSDDQAS
jgi:hypothetical protein